MDSSFCAKNTCSLTKEITNNEKERVKMKEKLLVVLLLVVGFGIGMYYGTNEIEENKQQTIESEDLVESYMESEHNDLNKYEIVDEDSETISFMIYEDGNARYYSTINKDYAENLYYSNHKLESQK